LQVRRAALPLAKLPKRAPEVELRRRPVERYPIARLGNALAKLGERESGTVSLEEAVTAYRSALQEMTRDRVPLEWGLAQMDLGAALGRLGERESGTARFEEAVVCCLCVTIRPAASDNP
jgi:hypothetical protein